MTLSDYFNMMIDTGFLDKIVHKTNKYADEVRF